MKQTFPYFVSFGAGVAVTVLFAHQLFWWQESRLFSTVLSTNLSDSYMLERDNSRAMLDRNRKIICSQLHGAMKANSAIWLFREKSLEQIIESAEQRIQELDINCGNAS